MNPSRSVPVRTAPRARHSSTQSGSVGVGSSAASAAPAELPPMSLDEIMVSPSRRLKPRLHPDRPNRPKDVWFSLDNCVRIDITSIYQNDFKGPWSCLSNVPPERQVQWWSRFAQRYYWEDEHHDAVVRLYRKQLRELIKNIISKAKRDGIKPDFVDPDDWTHMVERWDTPEAIKRSKTCSDARKSQRSGYGEHRHTAGSKPFTKIQYEMAEANNGVMPSIPDLIKRTHTKSDGTFVDKKAEKIFQEVNSLATQMLNPNPDSDHEIDSEEESTVSTPTPILLNKAFYQHVPVVKGYRFGLGSIQHTQGESSKSSTPCPSRQLHLEMEFAEMKGTVSSLNEHVSSLGGKFDTLQASVNIIIQTLTRGATPPITTQPEQSPQPSQLPQTSQPQPHRDLDLTIDDFNISS